MIRSSPNVTHTVAQMERKKMVSTGMMLLVSILYFTSQYTLSFWLIVLLILNGMFAVMKAIANPSWYMSERLKAGLDVNLFNPGKGIFSLIVTKVILIVILLFFAWKIGEKAGYL